jgi:hypothetical protein
VRFFQRLNPPAGLGAGYVALLDAIDSYVARGMPAEAARMRELLNRMWREYDKVSVEGALMADRLIRAYIRQTAVRPPTSGRLEGGILSRPITTVWSGGALGIADLDVLDHAAVNPRYKAAGEYWRAQEYGTHAHVGRRVPGFFQPGQSRPSAGDFRAHPYFEQVGGRGGKAPRGTPAMVIRRPIEARHFLRDGTDDLIAWRRREMSRINRHAISTLASI